MNFIEVDFKTKDGTTIQRFVNLDTISYMQVVSHADDSDRNPEGYKTVMYNNGGYALYSKLTPSDILAGVGYPVIPDEKLLIEKGADHRNYHQNYSDNQTMTQLTDY